MKKYLDYKSKVLPSKTGQKEDKKAVNPEESNKKLESGNFMKNLIDDKKP